MRPVMGQKATTLVMDVTDMQRSCDKPINKFILSINLAFYNVLTFTGNPTPRPKLKYILSARLRPLLSFSQHFFTTINQKLVRRREPSCLSLSSKEIKADETEKLFNGLSVNTAWGQKALAVLVFVARELDLVPLLKLRFCCVSFIQGNSMRGGKIVNTTKVTGDTAGQFKFQAEQWENEAYSKGKLQTFRGDIFNGQCPAMAQNGAVVRP
ncbi:hypothetical protein TNCT_131431 [Trichonephila clavata]|uniref:Uncharacterized protein n=1 Tax=Trichonephila clavata TaxID=2740835 RepID=A0A8X6I3F2_TRICU|nr:hypothetical protein TNCT_131431 [Trichonephila clavata]